MNVSQTFRSCKLKPAWLTLSGNLVEGSFYDRLHAMGDALDCQEFETRIK